MIADQAFGESFVGLGSYLRTGKDRVDPAQRVGWIELRNLPTKRMDIAERIMAGTASLSNTKKPVFHLSISFAPGDPVDAALMKRVMARTLSDLGLAKHQVVVVTHIDTDDPHVHAMVNRVHPETGVAWKGSWSRLRVEASLRQQELEEGLRVVPGWLARVPGHSELRPRPRLVRGDEEFLREVRDRAGPVLKRAQSWAEVEAGLAEFGLSVRVNGRGMSITDGRRVVKASEVGREFSRGKLEERFRRYSDYTARVAVASATPVRAPGGASSPKFRTESAVGAEIGSAAALQPRFSLFEDGEAVGVWDCMGPQLFFADTRERAEREVQRANWLVVRYPNIRAVRCLCDMDGEWRAARGLPRLPEDKSRPLFMRPPPVRTEPVLAVPVLAFEPGRSPDPDREEVPAPETSGPSVEIAATGPEHSSAPDLSRPGVVRDPVSPPAGGSTSFLDEVRARARPALLSESWAELEQGLSELGFSLRTKGGGFVVTDGQREVKASKVGREFSRFHLEERLGRYPDPHLAEPPIEVAPEVATPAPQPELAPRQDVLEQGPAAEREDRGALPDARRFTLFEEEGTYGVFDNSGPQLYFAETRERALEAVERANEIAAVNPNFVSMRHLHEMDGGWKDTRGLPRLMEPEGDKIAVPVRESVVDDLLPPIAREEPVVFQSPVLQEADAPEHSADAPVQQLQPWPGAPAVVRLREVGAEPTQSVPASAGSADSSVPNRKGMRPLTERERYKSALRAFKIELAALYRDPREARHAFAAAVFRSGGEKAVHSLATDPEQYGRLRVFAKPELAPRAAQAADLFAGWQEGRTRLAARLVARLYHQAAAVEAADKAIREAGDAADRATASHDLLADRQRQFDEAARAVRDELYEVFSDPQRAIDEIDAYRQTNGQGAMVRAVADSPELFGDLRAEKRYRLLGIVVEHNTSRARERAPKLAAQLQDAYNATEACPRPLDLARADEAVRTAQSALAAARSAREAAFQWKLSYEFMGEATRVLKRAAQRDPARTERLHRQLAGILPPTAMALAEKVLKLAHGQKRNRSITHSGPSL